MVFLYNGREYFNSSSGLDVFLYILVLPLLTATQLCMRWIAVTEHQYNIENADSRNVTPLIILKWWQKILMPDLNFAMHIYHHEHPGVSFSNLPRVHAIYQREGLVDESAVFDGQGAYLKFLIGKNWWMQNCHVIGEVNCGTIFYGFRFLFLWYL